MKAIIYKNNDFETFGIEIYDGDNLVFRWGVTSNIDWHREKWIDFSEVYEIMLEYEKTKHYGGKSTNIFFQIVEDNVSNIKSPDTGWNLEAIHKEKESANNRFLSLIKKL